MDLLRILNATIIISAKELAILMQISRMQIKCKTIILSWQFFNA